MAISAMNDLGKAVDWWFMYKVSGRSTMGGGGKGPKLVGKAVTGAEYVYFDADAPGDGKLALSPCRVDKSGALFNTLQQVYGAGSKSLGWFFYNDENPLTGKVNSARGHTKGVLAFDMDSNTAFWMIQSTPLFPLKGKYGFPKTGLEMAQTLFCITLEDATVAQSIAKQMSVAQQPNVYLASAVPEALSDQPNDPRVKLMADQVAQGSTPVHVVIPFQSKGGTKFMSIAKNKTWGLDFYNDLVGPTLNENLEVETWEHDPVPPSEDSDHTHDVVAMSEVKLTALGLDLAWSEAFDHAKLCISVPTESVHWVCVGDINYTIAQRKRGGGTVAFQCEALWQSLSEILTQTVAPPDARAPTKKAASPKAAAKKAARAPAKSAAKVPVRRLRRAPAKPAPKKPGKAASGTKALTKAPTSVAAKSVSRRTA